MTRNYEAIGGRSPLTDLTIAQGDALSRRLGEDVPVAIGMRNWTPFIKDAIAGLAARGVTRIIAIPLAPQFSTLSVSKYFDAAVQALPAGMSFDAVPSFHVHPLLLDAFAERLRDAKPAADEDVVFTAHSLPSRVVEAGDPYPTEVAATAAGVAVRSGVARYHVAYQAPAAPEPWIGPDVGASSASERRGASGRFLVAQSASSATTRDPVRYRRAGESSRAGVGRGPAPHGIAQHAADIHRHAQISSGSGYDSGTEELRN
jgi:ferrochelatase